MKVFEHSLYLYVKPEDFMSHQAAQCVYYTRFRQPGRVRAAIQLAASPKPQDLAQDCLYLEEGAPLFA